MQEKLKQLKEYLELPKAMNRMSSICYWDEHTGEGSPKAATPERARAMGIVQGEIFRLLTSKELQEMVDELYPLISQMDQKNATMVKRLKRQLDRERKIPVDEYKEFQIMQNEAENVWGEAKHDNDFARMKPYYEKIVAFMRKKCDWYGYEKHPYDALLDEYEEGATTEIYDKFFAALRENIVPLLKMAKEKDIRDDFLTWNYDIKKQAELSRGLASEIGFDPERGLIGETEHPFCMGVFPSDVRITTHYYENMLFSAIYSALHEGGHAIYEQNMDFSLDEYGLCMDASCAVHESQSRFYENVIGRSKEYIDLIEGRLKEKFPVLKDITADEIYRAVNKAKPSLIRTEADELTYGLHIMVRYELEKQLLEGSLTVDELPEKWNKLYEEYLGITPPNDTLGVLQDVHWSAGLFGYFPSYAIGSAYSAQLYHAMKKELDVMDLIAKGEFLPIKQWLGEHVHKHSALFSPNELIARATGEEFNPQYYVDYLTDKMTAIYRG